MLDRVDRGVVIRRIGGAALSLLLLLLGFAARTSAADPAPQSAPSAPAPERCHEGPGPIEILAGDVVIAIDRSTSTRDPTGLDLDGNGVVGEFRHSEYTDPGDSLLAAELAAVGRLVRVAQLGGIRFAIVSFSGAQPSDFPLEDSLTQVVDRRDARLEAELTDDLGTLEAAVARVERRGSDGASSFSPAMRLAVRTFGSGDGSARRRRVLFLADTPTPVRYAPMRRIARDDWRMQVVAKRAIAAGISFHSFGLGEAAGDPEAHALAQIAGATGGTYRAVPDPRNLYCQMLAALGAGDTR